MERKSTCKLENNTGLRTNESENEYLKRSLAVKGNSLSTQSSSRKGWPGLDRRNKFLIERMIS